MRRVYYHRIDNTYMQLKPLTDTATQLYRYASVYADISLWSILLLIHNISCASVCCIMLLVLVLVLVLLLVLLLVLVLVLHNIAASIVYHIVQYCIPYHIVLLILLYSPVYHTAQSYISHSIVLYITQYSPATATAYSATATAIVHILLLSFYHIQYSISVLLSYTILIPYACYISPSKLMFYSLYILLCYSFYNPTAMLLHSYSHMT